jgi:hypothetical protein
MGNGYPTRWGTSIVRQDTDALLKLDVHRLRRSGALQPGTVTSLTWCRGRQVSSAITVIMEQRTVDTLFLEYLLTSRGADSRSVRESVALTSTPCTFGGRRTWFRCPGCQSRRGVLFFLYGQFRCRACHNVAYTSTRKNKQD